MKHLLVATILSFWLSPSAAHACATCFGDQDSPQTQAANMAILFMLCVTGVVLALLSTLFVSLAYRVRNRAIDFAGAHTHE
jgi:hypothetical protein